MRGVSETTSDTDGAPLEGAPRSKRPASSPRTGVRFVTPAAATLLFFAARLCVGFADGTETSAAGLSGAGGGSASGERVSVEIRSVDDPDLMRPARRVPQTEGELLELFRRDGSVHFAGGEVEPVETPVREFTLEEVGVILVSPPEAREPDAAPTPR